MHAKPGADTKSGGGGGGAVRFRPDPKAGGGAVRFRPDTKSGGGGGGGGAACRTMIYPGLLRELK